MTKLINTLTEEQQKDCINRIRRFSGQANGIIKMIEDGRDTEDILTQIAAISSASKNLGKEILLNHIKNSIPEKELNSKSSSLEECINLFKYFT